MGVFGWSYPPGVTGNEPEIMGDYGPCEVCGYSMDDCICPECPVCGEFGNPECYQSHGLVPSPEQTTHRAEVDAQLEAEAKAEAAYFAGINQDINED